MNCQGIPLSRYVKSVGVTVPFLSLVRYDRPQHGNGPAKQMHFRSDYFPTIPRNS